VKERVVPNSMNTEENIPSNDENQGVQHPILVIALKPTNRKTKNNT